MAEQANTRRRKITHKPFESGTVDWLKESKTRLHLAMREFVAEWGDVETYIEDHLKELADAAIRREQEIRAALAANTPGSIRNKEANIHETEVWVMIKVLADILQNSPDAAKLCRRLNQNGVITVTRQQPFDPTAGILWPAADLKRCDSICQQIKRKIEAARSFWGK